MTEPAQEPFTLMSEEGSLVDNGVTPAADPVTPAADPAVTSTDPVTSTTTSTEQATEYGGSQFTYGGEGKCEEEGEEEDLYSPSRSVALGVCVTDDVMTACVELRASGHLVGSVDGLDEVRWVREALVGAGGGGGENPTPAGEAEEPAASEVTGGEATSTEAGGSSVEPRTGDTTDSDTTPSSTAPTSAPPSTKQDTQISAPTAGADVTTREEVTSATQPEVTSVSQADVTSATQAEVTSSTQAEVTSATQAEVTSATQAEGTSQPDDIIRTEGLVIGAGISGVVTTKCLRDAGFDVVCVERSGDVGGLWTYRPQSYGVMSFTHINVSKENYSFSDFPFPAGTPDFPHNRQMAQYVRDYVTHFGVDQSLRFHVQVNSVSKIGDEFQVTCEHVSECSGGRLRGTGQLLHYRAKYVAVATGHHTVPSVAEFPGQEGFKGKIYHSVDFKDAECNDVTGKRVVVVGIGNSAVDAACHCVEAGRCKPLYISSRSGAWVVPNYIFGSPIDHYACRLLLWLPWRLATFIAETIITCVSGNPKKWKLNPKMHAMQAQATVSPTLVHHIQRGEIVIKPNIKCFKGASTVVFEDGSEVEADHVILCTGYSISLPFLSEEIRKKVIRKDNHIMLYKNVFSPELPPSLAFIGLVQPASGGVLPISEMQARWWAELLRGRVQLPGPEKMKEELIREKIATAKRYYRSARHTIQLDPILYNDDIADMIGCRPTFSENKTLAWRLLLGSCGTAQYRLQGPGKWAGAREQVKQVPVTSLLLYGTPVTLILLYCLISWLLTCLLGCFF